jgi:5-amino-6-(5-phosphoribosylamino)uracil reductase
MDERPYTVLSCGVSLDGFIDSTRMHRLRLSNDADFDRVDGVRARCDAILVGAATVRNDNPRLLVRARTRQQNRVEQGGDPSPVKVTVTGGGQLDPRSAFFTAGDVQKLVYCPTAAVDATRERLGPAATIVDGGDPVTMRGVTADLYARGVRSLMVEGGQCMHTQFLTGDLADELHLVVAPFFVGDDAARRFVSAGRFPWNPCRRAALAEVRQIDDVVLMRYALSPRFCADRIGTGIGA